MTLSTSYLAYDDCFKLLDQALEAKKGIRIEYGERSVAGYHSLRFNQARSLDRERNKGLHEPGTELHGRSVYDGISIRQRMDDDGVWYVILVKIAAVAETLKVEELGDEFNPWEQPSLPPPRVTLELLPAPAVDGEPQEFGPKVRRI